MLQNSTNFSGDDMHACIVDYANLNHNISTILSEALDEVLDIEREVFQMKIK